MLDQPRMRDDCHAVLSPSRGCSCLYVWSCESKIITTVAKPQMSNERDCCSPIMFDAEYRAPERNQNTPAPGGFTPGARAGRDRQPASSPSNPFAVPCLDAAGNTVYHNFT